ncbi:hypothetical protein BHM03_00055138 [Ensete ventricosum]|nr:hypothetical protein BHM03_00055138 [Ensete ventricosum]
MKSCHDVVSVINEETLGSIWECYSIPEEYALRAPLSEQRPYNPESPEISISVDALEVSGASTNNKGWKARYFFISSPSWGFKVDWSIHSISNIPPLVSEEEFIMVNRLKGILPLFRAIWDMTELRLVEVGLSPASPGIYAFDAFVACAMDLNALCRKPRMPSGKNTTATGVENSPSKVEEIRVAVRKHKSRHGEGSSRRAAREKWLMVQTEEGSSPSYPRLRSMKDLCGTRVRQDDEGYYVLQMANWAPKDPSAMIRAQWPNLLYTAKVWDDSQAA